MFEKRWLYLLWAITVIEAGALGTLVGARYLRAATPRQLMTTPSRELPAPPAPWREPPVCATTQLQATVSRAVAERWFSMERLVTVVPAIANGHVAGIKLYGIRAGSPLTQIGLKNGDTVVLIQGMRLGTFDEALDVYRRLSAQPLDRIAISLLRQGCPVDLEIELVS